MSQQVDRVTAPRARSQVNMHEAKTQLSALVERVLAGEEVTIARAGTPVADLVPHRKRTVIFGLGKGKFQRRDLRLDVLTGSSAFSAAGTLFAHLGKHEIFTPTKTYPPMTVRELIARTPQATL